MGRFDQQNTTIFHRDNAAHQSFLMLGYEPTLIHSELYFADYIRLINDRKITENIYYEKHNPMTTKGELDLLPYRTKALPFAKENYKIVLINNSNTELNETYGIFHKAIIPNKNRNLARVINSTMLFSCDLSLEDDFSEEQQQNFIHTKIISK